MVPGPLPGQPALRGAHQRDRPQQGRLPQMMHNNAYTSLVVRSARALSRPRRGRRPAGPRSWPGRHDRRPGVCGEPFRGLRAMKKSSTSAFRCVSVLAPIRRPSREQPHLRVCQPARLLRRQRHCARPRPGELTEPGDRCHPSKPRRWSPRPPSRRCGAARQPCRRRSRRPPWSYCGYLIKSELPALGQSLFLPPEARFRRALALMLRLVMSISSR